MRNEKSKESAGKRTRFCVSAAAAAEDDGGFWANCWPVLAPFASISGGPLAAERTGTSVLATLSSKMWLPAGSKIRAGVEDEPGAISIHKPKKANSVDGKDSAPKRRRSCVFGGRRRHEEGEIERVSRQEHTILRVRSCRR